MTSEKQVLVFDLTGDYAHFRKVYTTASQLTYGIPPRTTLAGMIASLMGLERDSYYHLFQRDNSLFSIELRSPIKKHKINMNLLKTKDETLGLIDPLKQAPASLERIQVPFEMVKDPVYRIYTWFSEEEYFNKLENYLRAHKSIYTPFLGISELIGDFEFIDKAGIEVKEGSVHVDSVVPQETKIIVEPGKKYVRERLPGFFDKNRVPLDFLDLIYEPDGKPIKIEETRYWRAGGKNIIFF